MTEVQTEDANLTNFPRTGLTVDSSQLTFLRSSKSRDTKTRTNINKNSSGDEIANMNFLRRYRTYVLKNTKKEPTSFNQLDDS